MGLAILTKTIGVERPTCERLQERDKNKPKRGVCPKVCPKFARDWLEFVLSLGEI